MRQGRARTTLAMARVAVATSMALLLGVVGLRGVTAQRVRQRTCENGVRMAVAIDGGRIRGPAAFSSISTSWRAKRLPRRF